MRTLGSSGINITVASIHPITGGDIRGIQFLNAKENALIFISAEKSGSWLVDAPAPDLVYVKQLMGSRTTKLRALNNTTPEKAVAYVIKWLLQNADKFAVQSTESTGHSMLNYVKQILA